MMHSKMRQIAFKNVYTRLIFWRSTEIWNFQNRLGPDPGGRRYRFNSLRISAIGLKFYGMMHNMMKQFAT